MELIEDHPCENIEQLRAREGHFIRQFGTLNAKIAGRTKKEYNITYAQEHSESRNVCKLAWYYRNADKATEAVKAWRLKNKGKIQEQHHCDVCGGMYTHQHKSGHCKTKKHQQALQQES